MKKFSLMVISVTTVITPLLAHQHDQFHSHETTSKAAVETSNNDSPIASEIKEADDTAIRAMLDSIEDKSAYANKLIADLTKHIKDNKDASALTFEQRIEIRIAAQYLKYLLTALEEEKFFDNLDMKTLLEAKEEPGKIILALYYYDAHPELVTAEIQQLIDNILLQPIYSLVRAVKTTFLYTKESLSIQLKEVLKLTKEHSSAR